MDALAEGKGNGECATVSFRPGKLVAPLRAGWNEEKRSQWVEWLRETKRVVYSLRCKLDIPALWHKTMAAIHGWAGHMARTTDPHLLKQTTIFNVSFHLRAIFQNVV